MLLNRELEMTLIPNMLFKPILIALAIVLEAIMIGVLDFYLEHGIELAVAFTLFPSFDLKI